MTLEAIQQLVQRRAEAAERGDTAAADNLTLELDAARQEYDAQRSSIDAESGGGGDAGSQAEQEPWQPRRLTPSDLTEIVVPTRERLVEDMVLKGLDRETAERLASQVEVDQISTPPDFRRAEARLREGDRTGAELEAARALQEAKASVTVEAVREAQERQTAIDQTFERESSAREAALIELREIPGVEQDGRYDLAAAIDAGVSRETLLRAGFSVADVDRSVQGRATQDQRDAVLGEIQGLPGVARGDGSYDLVEAIVAGVSRDTLQRAGFSANTIDAAFAAAASAQQRELALQEVSSVPDVEQGDGSYDLVAAVNAGVTRDTLSTAGFETADIDRALTEAAIGNAISTVEQNAVTRLERFEVQAEGGGRAYDLAYALAAGTDRAALRARGFSDEDLAAASSFLQDLNDQQYALVASSGTAGLRAEQERVIQQLEAYRSDQGYELARARIAGEVTDADLRLAFPDEVVDDVREQEEGLRELAARGIIATPELIPDSLRSALLQRRAQLVEEREEWQRALADAPEYGSLTASTQSERGRQIEIRDRDIASVDSFLSEGGIIPDTQVQRGLGDVQELQQRIAERDREIQTAIAMFGDDDETVSQLRDVRQLLVQDLERRERELAGTVDQAVQAPITNLITDPSSKVFLREARRAPGEAAQRVAREIGISLATGVALGVAVGALVRGAAAAARVGARLRGPVARIGREVLSDERGSVGIGTTARPRVIAEAEAIARRAESSMFREEAQRANFQRQRAAVQQAEADRLARLTQERLRAYQLRTEPQTIEEVRRRTNPVLARIEQEERLAFDRLLGEAFDAFRRGNAGRNPTRLEAAELVDGVAQRLELDRVYGTSTRRDLRTSMVPTQEAFEAQLGPGAPEEPGRARFAPAGLERPSAVAIETGARSESTPIGAVPIMTIGDGSPQEGQQVATGPTAQATATGDPQQAERKASTTSEVTATGTESGQTQQVGTATTGSVGIARVIETARSRSSSQQSQASPVTSGSAEAVQGPAFQPYSRSIAYTDPVTASEVEAFTSTDLASRTSQPVRRTPSAPPRTPPREGRPGRRAPRKARSRKGVLRSAGRPRGGVGNAKPYDEWLGFKHGFIYGYKNQETGAEIYSREPVLGRVPDVKGKGSLQRSLTVLSRTNKPPRYNVDHRGAVDLVFGGGKGVTVKSKKSGKGKHKKKGRVVRGGGR